MKRKKGKNLVLSDLAKVFSQELLDQKEAPQEQAVAEVLRAGYTLVDAQKFLDSTDSQSTPHNKPVPGKH